MARLSRLGLAVVCAWAVAPAGAAAGRNIGVRSEVSCPSTAELVEVLRSQLPMEDIVLEAPGRGAIDVQLTRSAGGRLRVTIVSADGEHRLVREFESRSEECRPAAHTVALLVDGLLRQLPSDLALAPPSAPPGPLAPVAPRPEPPRRRTALPPPRPAPQPPQPVDAAPPEAAPLAPALAPVAQRAPDPAAVTSSDPVPPSARLLRASLGGAAFWEPTLPHAGWSVTVGGDVAVWSRLRLGVTATLDGPVTVQRDLGGVSASSRFFGAAATLSTLAWTTGSLDLVAAGGLEWIHAASEGYAQPASADLFSAGAQLGVQARLQLVGPLEAQLSAGVRVRRAEHLQVEGVGTVVELFPLRPFLGAGLGLSR